MSDGASEGVQDTFVSHLIELRTRLVRSAMALIIVLVPLAFYAPELYDLLASPMMKSLPQGAKMIATGIVSPAFIPLKTAMLVAFLIVLPFILYQAWAFIAPGLYQHEKRFVIPLIATSTVLFYIGMLFCYFIVFQVVFAGISKLAPASITVAPDIENYFNFVVGMFLAFGVAFETPVVVVVLVATDLVSLETLREVRRYVIVGAFIVAAIFTPPDVASQLALAIPLCILYELGIIFGRFFAKTKTAETETATS